MPVLPSVCARAGKALCQEVWHCLTGESPNWNHLDRWHNSHHNSPERYTLLLAAVYAANTKCWLLHTGCGVLFESAVLGFKLSVNDTFGKGTEKEEFCNLLQSRRSKVIDLTYSACSALY